MFFIGEIRRLDDELARHATGEGWILAIGTSAMVSLIEWFSGVNIIGLESTFILGPFLWLWSLGVIAVGFGSVQCILFLLSAAARSAIRDRDTWLR
jgi:hypothetical protein